MNNWLKNMRKLMAKYGQKVLLISCIGFTFKIRYSSTGKPISRGPVNEFVPDFWVKPAIRQNNFITVVSASFCTVNVVRDGKQAERSVWTTCASRARAITLNDRQGAKARFQANNKFYAAMIGNPNDFGGANAACAN